MTFIKPKMLFTPCSAHLSVDEFAGRMDKSISKEEAGTEPSDHSSFNQHDSQSRPVFKGIGILLARHDTW